MGRESLRRFLYSRLPAWIVNAYKYVRIRLGSIAAVWNADVWKRDPRVIIGAHTYGIRKSKFPILTAGTRIEIGKYCSVAQHVLFVVGRHSVERVSTFPFKAIFIKGGRADDEDLIVESIVVGNDVWIGTRAMVMANVTIGHGAVVAAGSIVVNDVPPYAIVAGVPAKVIKMRFNPQQIEKLLAIAWWDWPEEKIAANIDLFYGDADTFIAKFAPNPTIDGSK